MAIKKARKLKSVNMRLTIEQYIKIKELAKSQGSTVTSLIHEKILDLIPREYLYCRKCGEILAEKKSLIAENCAIRCVCGGWGAQKSKAQEQ